MIAHHRSKSKPESHLILRVVLRDIEPVIWRSLRIPDAYTLHQLHRVLQLVFGWLDYHLYYFRLAGRRFEAPDPEAEDEDATAFTLASIGLERGTYLEYKYDFGDGWIHDITVEAVAPMAGDAAFLPELLNGERAGPHEDSGGPSRYSEHLEILRDPTHPEHEELQAWAGAQYDPERFDPWLANQNLVLAAAWGAI